MFVGENRTSCLVGLKPHPTHSPVGARTHDLPYSRTSTWPLCPTHGDAVIKRRITADNCLCFRIKMWFFETSSDSLPSNASHPRITPDNCRFLTWRCIRISPAHSTPCRRSSLRAERSRVPSGRSGSLRPAASS